MISDLSARWYVVHTQPRSEELAAQHLRQQGYEIYLPRYQKKRRHARRVDVVRTPLFPRYLFVSLNLAQGWRAINGTVGVNYLVRNGDEPAPIPSAVIAEIKARENADGFVSLDLLNAFSSGDKVRVIDGAFSTCLGIFEEAPDQSRVRILLDLLGRKVRVLLEPDRLEAA